MVIVRQEVDVPPSSPGKTIGDSFLIYQNSKRRIAGQLREKSGPFPDHIFFIPQVRIPPRPHVRRKTPCRSKREQCQGMLYPYACMVESILAQR